MLYRVSEDEIYPVWSIVDQGMRDSYPSAGTIRLTREEMARIKAANQEWKACQNLIESKLVRLNNIGGT